MAQKLTNIYLLSETEYKTLTNAENKPVIMTQSKANKIIKSILKFHDSVCWHDNPEIYNADDWCCSWCPLSVVLGNEGLLLCDRSKTYGK